MCHDKLARCYVCIWWLSVHSSGTGQCLNVLARSMLPCHVYCGSVIARFQPLKPVRTWCVLQHILVGGCDPQDLCHYSSLPGPRPPLLCLFVQCYDALAEHLARFGDLWLCRDDFTEDFDDLFCSAPLDQVFAYVDVRLALQMTKAHVCQRSMTCFTVGRDLTFYILLGHNKRGQRQSFGITT